MKSVHCLEKQYNILSLVSQFVNFALSFKILLKDRGLLDLQRSLTYAIDSYVTHNSFNILRSILPSLDLIGQFDLSICGIYSKPVLHSVLVMKCEKLPLRANVADCRFHVDVQLDTCGRSPANIARSSIIQRVRRAEGLKIPYLALTVPHVPGLEMT